MYTPVYGAYCYKGFRYSSGHGWASGPTAWLTENVLGIKVQSAGCKTSSDSIAVSDLDFAEGPFPHPTG